MKLTYGLKKIKISLFIAIVILLLSSCDMINSPVKEFFTGAEKGLELSENGKADNSTADTTDNNTTDNTDNTDNTTDNDDGGNVTPVTPEINPGPVIPDDTEFDTIDTEVSFVMYVSAEGDDANDGSKEKPLQTIDKALSTLKANFQADTTKNAGYVLLLSDFEIASEIKLEDYNFGELSPNIVELTIAGYGGIRTLDAKSKCRIMKVGFTNGELKFKNLKFKDGNSSDVGGAGLYISSSGINAMVFCTINNCIFTENMSSYSGAAIALNTDYCVLISNCEFLNNTCSDGASVLDIKRTYSGSHFSISDTSIKDNTTIASYSPSTPVYDYGYVINTDELAALSVIGNVVIKDNSISQVSSDAGADYSKLGVIRKLTSIGGINDISSNSVYLDDGTELTRNLVVDTSSSEKIIIGSDCTGSYIGIKDSGNITAEKVFTSNYALKTSVSPASVFVCDGDYGIGYSSDGKEAAFVLSGGSFTNPLDNTMTFAVSSTTLTGGTAGTITVTPVVKNKAGTDITSSVLSDITWSLTLYNGSTVVAASSTNELPVSAAQALPDSYKLYIQATLNGITSDDTKDITITPGSGSSSTASLSTPLTLEAVSGAVTVTFVNEASGSVTYKINDGAGVEIASGTTGTISLASAGDKVAFFGDNAKYGASSSSGCSKISCSDYCYVYGNIMSLIDSTNYENKKELTEAYTFAYLFPNSKIKNKTNSELFLPATTLTDYCYSNMFQSCNSLEKGPELPASTLTEGCYKFMFSYCYELSEITCLATDISAYTCMSDWVYSVSSTGTFTKASSMTSWPTGIDGIPSGWTVQDYVAP